ncbi:low molecular weight phosphatase family protein [Microbacterium sp. SLBN-146]|uniref:arsenate reductase/protein-tyrosine-phosphatase family protein n=1 Tax=Microbacterium sp. SLBN-146 TaxID=2768457 RepID=UPI00114DFD7D|nr:low molecular weight phosphatase family protein [Microbacterium sp. SLBN-146]TQJ29695.1 protein-tyrosine phosphatase [Microbacterium sp. SLBN-146]
MFQILTVCTGNICRSPLAEQLLRARLGDLGAVVSSAGTRGLASWQMTPEAQHLAVHLGIPAADADAHRSRFLTEQHLETPDLILTMTREHRRAVAELAPARLRSTFTIREFARVAAVVPAAEIVAAADEGGTDAAARVRSAVSALAAARGLSIPPSDPLDDDVIDPFRQPWEVYQQSAAQLLPAIEAVAEVVRVAVTR